MRNGLNTETMRTYRAQLRYALQQTAKGEWQVLQRGKVIRTFSDWNAHEAACDYVQSCVEDDAWHASNR